MKIIVAEDDAMFARSLASALKEFKHTVTVCDNGEQAWETYQTDPVRLMISDWMMPKMDGLELCRKVRGERGPDYCYFILLTANTGRGEYAKAMDAGVDDFLDKPLDHQRLHLRLRVADRILTSTSRIRRLESLLPICSYCKRIREGDREWLQLEAYMSKHADAQFSHGICPECMRKVSEE